MFLVLSASLHPDSRSRIMAKACRQQLSDQQRDVQWFDLAESALPLCDGASAYGDSEVVRLGQLIHAAQAVFIASPVYNFDVNAALKNAIELTGKKWTGKTVAMMLAAGGAGSYMSGIGLANSLMLDFRCLIVPRFVYALGDAFQADTISDPDVAKRLEGLVNETVRISDALNRG
ncbi:NAD(P)H-dependent FAD/FMN reductase [Stieleria bergensis]|uniref:NAD(P)H-dependent FAD/FMN reductase n=1 Tax=Stieleria bergensis TaxID=2528025 RepID=A0A517SPL4_9BACT|nr:NAD(P)H-dependent FAD/FMN reductase [Planctomycetes bacterium SV_7m_r]